MEFSERWVVGIGSILPAIGFRRFIIPLIDDSFIGRITKIDKRTVGALDDLKGGFDELGNTI
jgi:hypothetical protein